MEEAGSNHLKYGSQVGNFFFERNIGSGAFASVWRAHHMQTKSTVAIKVINKSTINTQVARTRLQREIALLKQMDHPFVAELFQVIEDGLCYYLVMEYVENGNLLDYVNDNGRLSEEQARRYFGQLISVLEYLHLDKKVAHRDLKCENVLLDRYNNIRLIDFGLSNMFNDICPQLTTACGSPAYAAPEMIKGHTYTQAADIWSAGILLYSIVAGHLPYDDDNLQRLLQKIVYTDVFYPSILSPPLVDLLKKMICKDPESRINIERIKEHPWFSQAEYKSIIAQSKIYNSKWQTLDDQSTPDIAIDKEIIDKMTNLGIECHELHHSLLIGEFTELTGIYRILYREKMVEHMKDLMTNLTQNVIQLKNPTRLQTMPLVRTSVRPNAQPESQGQPLGQVPFPTATASQKPSPILPPVGVVRPRPMPVFTAAPQTPGNHNSPRVLQSPVLGNNMNRRLSRPVAVRRPVGIPGGEKPHTSFETP